MKRWAKHCPSFTSPGQETAPVEAFLLRGRNNDKNSKFPLKIASWNVWTLLHGDNLPERRTALLAQELKRYNLGVVALSQTRLEGEGSLAESSAGYTYFWRGCKEGQRRMRGISAYAPTLDAEEEDKDVIYEQLDSFLGGCLRAAEAGALGVRPDASKRHQGPEGPYTRHSKECRDDMPRGTTECPRCSRPGDLLKQKGGNSTLGFPLGGAGGGCGVGSHGHGYRECGSWDWREVGDGGKEPGTEEGGEGKEGEEVWEEKGT